MSCYQCPCGFVTAMTPRFGGEIVSIMHLHRSALIDGSSAVVPMVEIPCPSAAAPIDSDALVQPEPLPLAA